MNASIAADPKRRHSKLHGLVESVVTVAVAVGLAFVIQALLVKPYRIPSLSMFPTLRKGQRILVDRLSTHPGQCTFQSDDQVPAGEYYMMGDNRGISDDSRDWGPSLDPGSSGPRSPPTGPRTVSGPSDSSERRGCEVAPAAGDEISNRAASPCV